MRQTVEVTVHDKELAVVDGIASQYGVPCELIAHLAMLHGLAKFVELVGDYEGVRTIDQFISGWRGLLHAEVPHAADLCARGRPGWTR